jgi:hypothetical protein
MARTQLEKLLIQQRNQSGGIIVPLLNELMKRPLKISSQDDAEFLFHLAMRQVERENTRKSGDTVFSPSALAECLRKVYLQKNWKKLGFDRVEMPAIEPHGYFLEGDFKHLKWQFGLYRLAQVCDGFDMIEDDLPWQKAHGFEIPILSKRGDHGGTLDALPILLEEPLLIDIKGVNVRTFQKAVRGDDPHSYKIQISDYGMLLNSRAGVKLPSKVKKAIILYENKGGPDMRHPLALHETVVTISKIIPEVRARLEVLREHEAKEEIPEPECTSTKTIQFQGCPFQGFCKVEVKRVERRNSKSKGRNTKRLRVAKPKRSDSPRRPRS